MELTEEQKKILKPYISMPTGELVMRINDLIPLIKTQKHWLQQEESFRDPEKLEAAIKERGVKVAQLVAQSTLMRLLLETRKNR